MSASDGRPLRVGLNLVFLGEGGGGVGRYATELPAALLEAEPRTELVLFVSREAPRSLRDAPWADAVRWVALPVRPARSPLHVPLQFAGLPPLALARRLDVLHSPGNTGPAVAPGLASVVSLNDLIWIHHASEWEPSRWVHLRMRVLVRHCVRHADRLFTISDASARDIAQTLGVAPARIDVTPLGVRVPAAPTIEAGAVRARLELGSARVLLCVAQKRPYKNLHSLVRALPALDDDVVLVLPGEPTPYEQELRALAQELGVGERVRFPPWLSDAELDGLYALSEAFVLPSLIEGFGMPVLEAMARGLPVACSNTTSLPEVAGDAALLFDPQRQEEITTAVRRLIEDRRLAAELVRRGHERVEQFSWRRTGELSLAGYRRAIAQRSARGGTASAGPGAPAPPSRLAG